MARLVGLCGYAGAGKDIAADGLVQAGWRRFAFADALKEIAHDAFGWEGEKDQLGRILLQNLGMAVREHIHPDAWLIPFDRIFASSIGPIVVTDVRFPNEIVRIHAAGGLLVQIVRPGIEPVNQHVSELAWNGADFDAVLQNDGPPELIQARLLEIVDR